MNQDSQLQQFIDTHVALVEPLAREANLADWDLQTAGSPEAKERSTDLNTRLAKIYADPQEYAFLQSLQSDGFDSPLLARQHLILRNAYLENQMDERVLEEIIALENDIEELFNTHRGTVQGKEVSDNEIEDILIESKDASLRREAWEASKTVGSVVADKVLHLVRLRNREARRLGFENYYTMSLTLQELDEKRLFTLLNDLHSQSEPLWKAYKSELDAKLSARFQTTPDQIRPWHHANRFFQQPEPGEADLNRFFGDKDLEVLTEEFFAAIGLPIDDLLQRADLYERPGKCQHAFCMDVDRKGDVRVLCNNRPNERWMGTMLHEFGHAVYDKFLDPDLPYLLRTPTHTMTTESIALFMGRLSKDAHWLHRYADVPAEEAERIAGAARKEVRDGLLVFMHWCFVMAYFERDLYRDPDQDLNTLWWNHVERFQGIVRPEGRNAPDWAAKIHLASSPVYYHNYQLGEMLASQLLHHIKTVVLAGEPAASLVTNPKVGTYLMDKLFAPGAVRPWEQWLEHATGEPLNPRYFVEQLQHA